MGRSQVIKVQTLKFELFREFDPTGRKVWGHERNNKGQSMQILRFKQNLPEATNFALNIM
jgi:hypothetical protein